MVTFLIIIGITLLCGILAYVAVIWMVVGISTDSIITLKSELAKAKGVIKLKEQP